MADVDYALEELELQHIAVGTLFPAVPDATDGFHVLQFETGRCLVLGWRSAPMALPIMTWAFVLEAVNDGTTRLVVRARAARGYPFYGLPPSIGMPFIRFGHFIMQRKQLLGVAGRAEGTMSHTSAFKTSNVAQLRVPAEKMGRKSRIRTALKWTAGALTLATAAYSSYVGVTWLRYGHPAPARTDDADPLLDRFMPKYEIVERHHIRVAAPAAVTLKVAREVDLQASPVVRSVIRAREVLLGATPDTRPRPRGLLAETQSLGWGVLAEVAERQVVVGAVTQPWEANVTFRALPPDQFAAFNQPGYVKIAWTIRADAIGETESIFRTETRAIATDPEARTMFRRYWSFLSPGIIVIRWGLLAPVRKEAERLTREGIPSPRGLAAH